MKSRGDWKAEGKCIPGRLTKAGLREGCLSLPEAQQRAWSPRAALNPLPVAH